MLKTLFTPLTLKSITIPNRLAVSPMVTNYCHPDGTASERYLAYHEAKAQGGFGLIITEDYAITPHARGFVNVAGLWDDRQIESHSELPRRVHRHGAKILAQIYHAGRQTSSAVIGRAPVAPSPVPDPYSQEVPRELTVEEIEQIVEQFGDCAWRARECGFDGVEIHGSHGYLIAEFMSPYANKRTDDYGGPLMNRLRFPLAVIREVRRRCGDDFLIDFRLAADEFVPGGRTIEGTKTIAPILAAAGLDLIHVSCGVYASMARYIPAQNVSQAMLAHLAGEVKSVVDIPVITVGRHNDVFVAEQVLASGRADLVAMGRQSLADPATPVKAREGRLTEIRQCIACNVACLNALMVNDAVACVLNPTLGLEYRQPEGPVEVRKKVTVIGGGPGGAQAAISAAGRGHLVTLYEKSDRLGGQFRLAAMPPSKGELAAFLNWQENQLKRLGVEVHLNTEITGLDFDRPELVILATGAVPLTPGLAGADGPNVVQAIDILAGRALPGRRVVVIGGGQVGAETADYLGLIGREVTLVEMRPEIAAQEVPVAREALLESLERGGVRILTGTVVREITPRGVATAGGPELPADTVALALGVRSENRLKEIFEAAGWPVAVIGDALTPRQVHGAVSEGHEAALSL